jgi:DNA-binding transcriptional ArsR family regulator
MQKIPDDVTRNAEIFKVLSDPTRLHLFQILLKGIHCNCELGGIMGISANLVSHHIRVLTCAGLVVAKRSDRDARWIYYSVNEEKITQVRQSIDPFFSTSGIPEREAACPPEKILGPVNEVISYE